MARKRMIDPEFWSDEAIGGWSDKAKLFYIALWNFSDDKGRFKAHSALLKSQIFPYDGAVDIDALKKELGNKIEWYTVDGAQYGFVRNFLKWQRIDKPTPSKLPLSPSQLVESSTMAQGVLPPNRSKEKLSKEKLISTGPSASKLTAQEERTKADLKTFMAHLTHKLSKCTGAPQPSAVRKVYGRVIGWLKTHPEDIPVLSADIDLLPAQFDNGKAPEAAWYVAAIHALIQRREHEQIKQVERLTATIGKSA